MRSSQALIPSSTDTPIARMDNGIPVLQLDGSLPYHGDLTLQFYSDDPDDAVRYLTALAEQAAALVEQIRAHQTRNTAVPA